MSVFDSMSNFFTRNKDSENDQNKISGTEKKQDQLHESASYDDQQWHEIIEEYEIFKENYFQNPKNDPSTPDKIFIRDISELENKITEHIPKKIVEDEIVVKRIVEGEAGIKPLDFEAVREAPGQSEYSNKMFEPAEDGKEGLPSLFDEAPDLKSHKVRKGDINTEEVEMFTEGQQDDFFSGLSTDKERQSSEFDEEIKTQSPSNFDESLMDYLFGEAKEKDSDKSKEDSDSNNDDDAETQLKNRVFLFSDDGKGDGKDEKIEDLGKSKSGRNNDESKDKAESEDEAGDELSLKDKENDSFLEYFHDIASSGDETEVIDSYQGYSNSLGSKNGEGEEGLEDRSGGQGQGDANGVGADGIDAPDDFAELFGDLLQSTQDNQESVSGGEGLSDPEENDELINKIFMQRGVENSDASEEELVRRQKEKSIIEKEVREEAAIISEVQSSAVRKAEDEIVPSDDAEEEIEEIVIKTDVEEKQSSDEDKQSGEKDSDTGKRVVEQEVNDPFSMMMNDFGSQSEGLAGGQKKREGEKGSSEQEKGTTKKTAIGESDAAGWTESVIADEKIEGGKTESDESKTKRSKTSKSEGKKEIGGTGASISISRSDINPDVTIGKGAPQGMDDTSAEKIDGGDGVGDKAGVDEDKGYQTKDDETPETTAGIGARYAADKTASHKGLGLSEDDSAVRDIKKEYKGTGSRQESGGDSLSGSNGAAETEVEKEIEIKGDLTDNDDADEKTSTTKDETAIRQQQKAKNAKATLNETDIIKTLPIEREIIVNHYYPKPVPVLIKEEVKVPVDRYIESSIETKGGLEGKDMSSPAYMDETDGWMPLSESKQMGIKDTDEAKMVRDPIMAPTIEDSEIKSDGKEKSGSGEAPSTEVDDTVAVLKDATIADPEDIPRKKRRRRSRKKRTTDTSELLEGNVVGKSEGTSDYKIRDKDALESADKVQIQKEEEVSMPGDEISYPSVQDDMDLKPEKKESTSDVREESLEDLFEAAFGEYQTDNAVEENENQTFGFSNEELMGKSMSERAVLPLALEKGGSKGEGSKGYSPLGSGASEGEVAKGSSSLGSGASEGEVAKGSSSLGSGASGGEGSKGYSPDGSGVSGGEGSRGYSPDGSGVSKVEVVKGYSPIEGHDEQAFDTAEQGAEEKATEYHEGYNLEGANVFGQDPNLDASVVQTQDSGYSYEQPLYMNEDQMMPDYSDDGIYASHSEEYQNIDMTEVADQFEMVKTKPEEAVKEKSFFAELWKKIKEFFLKERGKKAVKEAEKRTDMEETTEVHEKQAVSEEIIESPAEKVISAPEEFLEEPNEEEPEKLFEEAEVKLVSDIEYEDEAHTVYISGIVLGDVSGENVILEETSVVRQNVYAKAVCICAPDSVINGNIAAENVVIEGVVRGNVYGKGSVHIKNDAMVFGDVEANNLTIDEKAIVQGNISKID